MILLLNCATWEIISNINFYEISLNEASGSTNRHQRRCELLPFWLTQMSGFNHQMVSRYINNSYPSSRVPNWSIFRVKTSKHLNFKGPTKFHRHCYFFLSLPWTQLRWPIFLYHVLSSSPVSLLVESCCSRPIKVNRGKSR